MCFASGLFSTTLATNKPVSMPFQRRIVGRRCSSRISVTQYDFLPTFLNESRGWQDIAAEASREKDPHKLLRLTKERERTLEQRYHPRSVALSARTPAKSIWLKRN